LKTVGKAGYGTYFIFGSFCFSMFFYVWLLIPETEGMSLERMDDMYALAFIPCLSRSDINEL
jgi:hypothetical protein